MQYDKEVTVPDRPSAGISPATVLSWIPEGPPTLRFDSLEQALDHCRKHLAHLSAVEVFVHTGEIPEPIISGDQLAELILLDKAS